MKLKKGGDFSVFSTQNIMGPTTEPILSGPKFDAFSFVNKDSLSSWTEGDANSWGTTHLANNSMPNIAHNTTNITSDMEPGLADFSDSFLDEVASKLDNELIFIDKEESDIWNSTQLSQPTSPSMKKKNKKAPVVEEKAVIEEELSKQNLYKTELCRSFQDTGICRYGHKCQFAHGVHEIRPVMRHPKYKTEVCKKFASTGQCPYGVRCRFIHPVVNGRMAPVMPAEPSPSVVWSNSWATPQMAEEKKTLPMKKAPPAPIGTPLGVDAADASARRLAFFQSIA